MPDERRLLVAGDAGDGQRDAEEPSLGDDLGGAHEPRQQLALDAEEGEQLLVPVEVVQAEQHRPRGIRQIGDVGLAAGQAPDEPGVDRAEREAVTRHVSVGSSHSSFVAEK